MSVACGSKKDHIFGAKPIKCERRRDHTHGHFAVNKKTGIVTWWYR